MLKKYKSSNQKNKFKKEKIKKKYDKLAFDILTFNRKYKYKKNSYWITCHQKAVDNHNTDRWGKYLSDSW